MEAAVVASSLGLGSLASVGLYKLVRPRFPVSVNCHFCNKDFKVSGDSGEGEKLEISGC